MSASPELRRLSPEMVLPTPAVAGRLPHGYHHQSSASPPPAKEKTELLEEDRFRTPTTEESKLNSAPSICPPAPVKLRRGAGCKRKLLELEFFRVEAEEIERLFRPIPAASNLQSFKRRKQLGEFSNQEETDTSSSLSYV